MVFRQQKVIGIIGSGTNPHSELAVPLARWIARNNYHLLTGGGGGVMAAASKAFCEVENRSGISIGILPTESDRTGQFTLLAGYPNPWVELNIVSPLSRFDPKNPEQLSRNYICILSSDLIVALPGSIGTQNEVELAIRFQKPIILFGTAEQTICFPSTLPKTAKFTDVVDFILSQDLT